MVCAAAAAAAAAGEEPCTTWARHRSALRAGQESAWLVGCDCAHQSLGLPAVRRAVHCRVCTYKPTGACSRWPATAAPCSPPAAPSDCGRLAASTSSIRACTSCETMRRCALDVSSLKALWCRVRAAPGSTWDTCTVRAAQRSSGRPAGCLRAACCPGACQQAPAAARTRAELTSLRPAQAELLTACGHSAAQV